MVALRLTTLQHSPRSHDTCLATVGQLYLPCLQREGLWREPTGLTTVTVSPPDTGERCRRDRVRLRWLLTRLQASVLPLKHDSDGHVANGCLLTEMRKEMRNYCKLGSCHWQPYYHTQTEWQYTHMQPQRLQKHRRTYLWCNIRHACLCAQLIQPGF